MSATPDINSQSDPMDTQSTLPSTKTKTKRLSHPNKDEIALLPTFQGLGLEQIELLKTLEQYAQALVTIRAAGVVGFDTESKPLFQKGAVSDGPHVVQLALADRAYIIQTGTSLPERFLLDVLASPDIIKVGFGLRSDRAHLQRKFGIQLAAVVDLTGPLRTLGYKQALGVKAAVAVLLGENLAKSKSLSTSNWARAELQPAQLLYAANDAFAALKVYQALKQRSVRQTQQ